MTDLQQRLSSIGVTFEEARAFVYKHLSNPQKIYHTASFHGVSYDMLAELYGQGVSVFEVKEFFFTHGFDVYGNVPYGAAGGAVATAIEAQTFQRLGLKHNNVDSSELVKALASEKYYWPSFQTLTYSTPDIIPYDHKFVVNNSNDWRALTVYESEVAASLIEYQNSIIDLAIESRSATDTFDAKIRLAAVRQDQGTEAFAYYPEAGLGGDIFLNANVLSDSSYYASGGYGRHTFLHELGHAMGLDHPFEGLSRLPESYDNSYYTVMTYDGEGTLEVELGITNEGYRAYTIGAYRNDFGIIDIAALQKIYGPNVSSNAQDTIYTYHESERKFESSDNHYLTIWDAGGIDTLDFSDARYGSTIYLEDFSVSSVSQRSPLEEAIEISNDAWGNSFTIEFLREFIDSLGDKAFLNENNLSIAEGVVIENVVTGKADDFIRDNEVDNLINTGKGDDTIYLGAGGYDIVDGGPGNDRVVFSERLSDTVFAREGNDFQVYGEGYSARLIGIEWIQFSDTGFSIA